MGSKLQLWNRLLIVLLCMVMLSSIWLPIGNANVGSANVNLFVNPGFESGNWNGWYEWHPWNKPLSLGVDGYDVKSGSKKAYFWSSNPYQQSIHQLKTGLVNGKYEVSVWVKVSAYGGNPYTSRMEVMEYGGPILFTNLPSNGNWTLYKQTVNVTTGKLDLGIYVDSPGRTSVQIDDASLVMVPVNTPTPTVAPTTQPTVAPTTQPTATPQNVLTVYYKPAFIGYPYIHYQPNGGNWTVAPGVKMTYSEVSGYYKAVINLGSANSVKFCFTNGMGVWDNNKGLDYQSTTGTIHVNAGKIITGAPEFGVNLVTIYYRVGLTTPHLHYRPEGEAWTNAPGVAMQPSEVEGYYKITVNIFSSNYIEACFNNGDQVWDTNAGLNYIFNTGVYAYANGIITKGVPAPSTNAGTNGTMIQYYEWDQVADGQHWNRLNADAKRLADVGFTAVWLPPLTKGHGGSVDVGYGVYDHYDIGEFNQRGSVRTKYGTKSELVAAVDSIHARGMQAYADIVMNQLIGAPGDEEIVQAVEVNPWNRNQEITAYYDIKAYTKLNYSARNGKYSAFQWNASLFNGTEYNANNGKKAIYKFAGKAWSPNVDTNEYGNYDFLLGTDVDTRHPAVQDYFKQWGVWLTNEVKLDGYRLDAAKHIDFGFMKAWVNHMRAATGKNLYAVAEYASGNQTVLENYLNQVGWNQSVFDFKLKGNFSDASKANGTFDMRYLNYESFAMKHPFYTSTKVNSHDSQPGQVGGFSYIPQWFQPIAYAYILTRQEGYPFVFYGDYYGIPSQKISPLKSKLDPLLRARKDFAYGKQNDYFNHADIVGWTREGDAAHPNSGLATIITDGLGGSKWMYVGKQRAGETWYDLTQNRTDIVTINADGWGEFKVNGGSASVYVNRPKN